MAYLKFEALVELAEPEESLLQAVVILERSKLRVGKEEQAGTDVCHQQNAYGRDKKQSEQTKATDEHVPTDGPHRDQ